MEKGFHYVKEKIKQVPTSPGCYLMKDHDDKIFYIGKAKNLKARLKSYFLGSDTRAFVQFLEKILFDIEILLVKNETESLILEKELINKHKPRFNIMLKDDKNYILLKIKKPLLSGKKCLEFPKIEVVRKVKKDQAKYFGPFPSAGKLRMTLELINKYFKLRTCPDNVIDNRARPCIQYQIGRCPAPCVYEVAEYKQEIENVNLFLSGNYGEIEKRLSKKMLIFAQNEQFEAAAKVRDQLEAIKTSLTTQVVREVNLRKDQDVIGFAKNALDITVVQIKIRNGAWQQSRSFHFENQPFNTAEILSSFLNQAYLNSEVDIFPHEILLPFKIEDAASFSEILSKKASRVINILNPSRGKKLRLIEIANKNAEQSLSERLNQNKANEKALTALQNTLGLNKKPRRIECVDISLIQGSDAVGSVVVFIDGVMDKNLYRIFNIKTVEGMNDFAMIQEVVSRRISRGIKENNMPDLMLIDGGKGQLNAAIKACDEQNLIISNDGFFVAGIAKARTLKDNEDEISRSDERLFVPNQSEPIILKKHSIERYLVERIRDEAHRFAITKHRQKRKQRTLQSSLLKINGVGKINAAKLLKHFGSVIKVKEASAEEIAKILRTSVKKALEIMSEINQIKR